jgi:hypothetical protein
LFDDWELIAPGVVQVRLRAAGGPEELGKAWADGGTGHKPGTST